MARKASLFLVAIALAGFAAPTAASAAPSITIFPGVLAATGSRLLMTSTNSKVQTSLGNLTCNHMATTLTLVENIGFSIRGENFSEGEASICNLGKPATVTDVTLRYLTSTVANSGTINLSLKADLVGGIQCEFESGSAPITYSTGSSKIVLANADLIGRPAACEPALFSGEFAITSAGSSVILD